MEKKLHVSLSPHITSNNSTQRIMLDVILALLPVSVASVILFGIPALLVIAVCVITAVAGEAIFNIAIKKEQTVCDLSAAVTGLILALNLPANVPLSAGSRYCRAFCPRTRPHYPRMRQPYFWPIEPDRKDIDHW